MVDSDMGRLWWRRTPHPVAASSPAWRGVAAYGALAVALGAGLMHYIPGPPAGHATAASPQHVRTDAVFHHIVLPDLAVIEPAGVSPAEVARIAKVPGIRQVLPLDGASLVMGSRRVNVIGVNAQLYRSWTPLSTASNEQLWNSLSAGAFIASPAARHHLRLRPGSIYPVTGAATVNLRYAGAAPLGIKGIDMVVAARVSARLGLVHHVAVLISAPSVSMNKLRREVRAASGHHAQLVTLRAQSPALGTVHVSPSTPPTTYLQLFQESAAKFCPGLPWTVLAAIGQIESGDGANTGPSSAGALGPMQFLPSTWREWGITATVFGQKGPPDINNPFDAVPSAARYLCAAGGATAAGLPRAIFAYNHATWYVNEVLALAKAYAQSYG
jgi:Transglycosylase SLT domain